MYVTLGMLQATTGGVAPTIFPTLASHSHRSQGTGSSAARTIPYPVGITAGQLLVLAVTLQPGSGGTVSTPTGYTKPSSGVNVFYKVAVGGETGNLTFHLNTSSTASNSGLFVFTNASMAEAAASTGAAAANANPPPLTVSWGAANNLFMALYYQIGLTSDFGGGYPSNCSLYHSTSSGGSANTDEAVAGAESALATFDPAAFTSDAGDHMAFTIGIKP